MALVTLVQAGPFAPATGIAAAVRLAGGGTRPYSGYLGFTDWRQAVVEPLRFTTSIGFDDNGWTSEATPKTGILSIGTTDAVLLAQLQGYYWIGAAVTVSIGDDAAGTPAFSTQLVGTIAGAAAGDGLLRLTIADLAAALAVPVAAGAFSGGGGIEGGTDATGRVKRRSWGRVFNVEGRLLDKASNVYEFGDPAQPLNGFQDLRDKGRSAGSLALLGWQGSIAATFAALKAAAVPSGGGVVAPSIACVKWWTQPSGPLTADLSGETGAAYVETAPEIAQVVAGLFGGLAIANAAAFAAARPWTAGIHCDSASETAAQLLDRLLLGVHLTWILQPAGGVVLREFAWAGPVEALVSRGVTRTRLLPPLGTRTVGYKRNHRPQSDAEISSAVLAADVTYPDGTPVSQLQPAVAGATQNIDTDLADYMAYPQIDAFAAAWAITPAGAVAQIAIATAADLGGRVVVLGDNAGNNDTVQGVYNKALPYDPAVTYVIEFDWEVLAAGDAATLTYLGVQALDAAGAALAADGGAFCAVAVSAAPIAATTGRRKYQGIFRGTGATGAGLGIGSAGGTLDAPARLPNGTVAIKPLFRANYKSAGTGNGQSKLHAVTLRRATVAELVDVRPAATVLSQIDVARTTIAGIQVDVGTAQGNIASLVSSNSLNADKIAAQAALITSNATAISGAVTSLNNEITRAQGQEGTLFTQVSSAQTAANGAISAIATETTQRTTADSALGARIDTLTTTVGGNGAAITSEIAARASADGALAVRADTLTASSGPTILNPNPNFALYGNASGTPDLWSQYIYDGGVPSRVPAINGPGYAVRFIATADNDDGIMQTLDLPAGAYVIEATAELVSGSWNGASLAVYWFTSSDTVVAGASLNFSGETDTSGYIGQNNGARRTWSKYFTTGVDASIVRFKLYAMANWSPFPPRAAKTIIFRSVRLRAASAAEIAAQRADTNATLALANVTTEVSARTTADMALGGRIDTVTTSVGTAASNLTSEISARTTADSALGVRIDTLTTTVGGNGAAITSEIATRTSETLALGSRADTLTASAGPTILNRNPNFGLYTNATGTPNGWDAWVYDGGTPTRAPALSGAGGYACQVNAAANANCGFYQIIDFAAGAYVLEATADLVSGSWDGAGLFASTFAGAATVANYYLSFLTTPDTAGYTGAAGFRRTWTLYFNSGVNGSINRLNLFAMANWSDFGAARSAKTIIFRSIRIRAASAAEIAGQKALADLGGKASIAQMQQVGTDASTALANYKTSVDAQFSGATQSGLGTSIGTVNSLLGVVSGPGGTVSTRLDAIASQFSGATASGLLTAINVKPSVSEVNASISSAISAATGPSSALATRTSIVEASIRPGSPNLLVNSDFGDGLRSWTPTDGGVWYTVAGFSIGTFVQSGSTGGTFLYQDVPVQAGTVYSLSFEADPDAAADGYVYLDWLNGSGGVISNSHSISSDGWVRAASDVANATFAAPSGATGARIRLRKQATGGVFRATRVQFQAGAATVWRNDAGVANLSARVTVSEAALVDVKGKQSAYFSVAVAAGQSRAQLTLFAVDGAGVTRGGIDLVGDLTISGNLLVGGSIQAAKLGYGATGQTSVWHNEGSPIAAWNRTDAWTAIAQVQLESQLGQLIIGSFSCLAQAMDEAQSRIWLRVRRVTAAGNTTIIKSSNNNAGILFAVLNGGSSIAVDFIDTVPVNNTSTTWFLDIMKANGSTTNVQFDSTYMRVTELSKDNIQHTTIAYPPSGAGPGAGTGGGGNLNGTGSGVYAGNVTWNVP